MVSCVTPDAGLQGIHHPCHRATPATFGTAEYVRFIRCRKDEIEEGCHTRHTARQRIRPNQRCQSTRWLSPK